MSFGLGKSFGKVCRLEKLRKELFGTNQPFLEVETDNYIYRQYDSFTTCEEVDFPGWKITYFPFSIMDKKALVNLIDSECT